MEKQARLSRAILEFSFGGSIKTFRFIQVTFCSENFSCSSWFPIIFGIRNGGQNLVEKNVLFQPKSFDSKSCPEKLCPKMLLIEKITLKTGYLSRHNPSNQETFKTIFWQISQSLYSFDTPYRQLSVTSSKPINTFKTLSRLFLDTFQTPSCHLPESF